MPSITIQFYIEHVLVPHPPCGSWLYLPSLIDYREIVGMFYPDEKTIGRGREGGSLAIRCDIDDVRLKTVFEILKQHGFTPTARQINNAELDKTEFQITLHRTYAKEEIASADFLRMSASYTYPLADWEYGGDDEGGWLVSANARLKKKLQFGCCTPFAIMLFGEELKGYLEAENLKALHFVPVRYDKPERAARQLWQIAPTIKMPPCLLQRLTQARNEFKEEDKCGALWDDAGYWPAELKFQRSEVKAMLPFDVAATIEKVGDNDKVMHSEIIVTQRFREVMAKAKIKGIDYVPVRLVD